jgi:catechol 2,3-dioxygenase-like lactoylglutathione lyase family enzyme
MARIRHVAVYTDDPEKLADFYIEVFGMEKKQETHTAKGGHAIFLSDGYLDFALINPELRDSPRGVHHFGFTLEPAERDGVYDRLKARGIEPAAAPRDRPYIEDAVFDPDGNKFDVSTSGLRPGDIDARPEAVPAAVKEATLTK